MDSGNFVHCSVVTFLLTAWCVVPWLLSPPVCCLSCSQALRPSLPPPRRGLLLGRGPFLEARPKRLNNRHPALSLHPGGAFASKKQPTGGTARSAASALPPQPLPLKADPSSSRVSGFICVCATHEWKDPFSTWEPLKLPTKAPLQQAGQGASK